MVNTVFWNARRNDLGTHAQTREIEVKKTTGTFTLYCITINDPDHMQTMLNKLRAYALRKSLTFNIQKSEVMCFNSYASNLAPLFYDGMIGL